jgi:hypothetical protein
MDQTITTGKTLAAGNHAKQKDQTITTGKTMKAGNHAPAKDKTLSFAKGGMPFSTMVDKPKKANPFAKPMKASSPKPTQYAPAKPGKGMTFAKGGMAKKGKC